MARFARHVAALALLLGIAVVPAPASALTYTMSWTECVKRGAVLVGTDAQYRQFTCVKGSNGKYALVLFV